MRLIINNFRCIKDLDLIFGDGITSISGESGQGKSTIFEAINFALYDGRNYSPIDDKDCKVSVTVITDKIKITRQKRPNAVFVQYKDKEYHDKDSTSAIIAEVFGDSEMWEIFNYISQGNEHIFLKGLTSKHKMEIIGKCALGNNFSIEDLINRVNLKIKEEEHICRTLQNKYEVNKKQLIQMIKSIDQKTYDELTTIKNGLEEKIQKGETFLTAINEKIYDFKLELQMCDKEFVSQEEYDEILIKIAELEKLTKDYEKFQAYQMYKDELESLELGEVILTDEEIYELSKTNRESLKYQQDNVRYTIQQQRKKYIDIIENSIKESQESQIAEIRNKLKMPDTLNCPSCDSRVYFSDNKLILSNENEISKKELRKQLAILEDKQESFQAYEYYSYKLNELPEVECVIDEAPIKPKNYRGYKCDEEKLIKLYDKLDEAKTTVEKQKNYRDAAKRYTLLQKKLSGYPENLNLSCDRNEIQNELKELYMKKGKLNVGTFKKTRSKDEIQKQLDAYIKKYEEAKNILPTLKNNLVTCLNKIQTSKYAETLEKETNKIGEEYQIVSQRVTSYNKIKINLSTAMCIAIDNFLNNLNVIINSVLDKLFNEPISVRIVSFKSLKKDNSLKPAINIEIDYKGMVYTKFNDLSGGERARVSIAVLIAFAKIGNRTGLLLLDEVTASLNIEKKEEVVNCVREFLPNMKTLMINHDTTEGIYNNIIHM